MNNKQYEKIEKHYNKLVKNKTIKTLNDSLIYKLAIDKAFSLCGVVKELPCKESVVSELLKDLFKIIEDANEKIKQLDRFKEYREAVANMQKDELKR